MMKIIIMNTPSLFGLQIDVQLLEWPTSILFTELLKSHTLVLDSLGLV